MSELRRVWAEVDLAAWRHNYRVLAAQAAPAQVFAVIKANAYGLGAVAAARALAAAGAPRFVFSSMDEALDVLPLNLGRPVQLLGAPVPAEIPLIVEHGVIASVPDVPTARRLSAEAVRRQRTVRIHLQIDTGMGHVGLRSERARDDIAEIARLPGLEVEGIYSHFPAAEKADELTLFQIENLASLIADLERGGLRIPLRHIANSAGLSGLPGALKKPFNAARPGIALHGASMPGDPLPAGGGLREVLTLKTRLVSVRELPAGATVGYGRTFRMEKPLRVGAVAIGYADGYHRDFSNCGEMLIRGRRCPVVGRICMDYTPVLLDAVPDAEIGDEVVVYGRQRHEAVPVAAAAARVHTISYELLTMLGRRVERVYVNGETA